LICKLQSQAKEWRYVALGMARPGKTASDIVSRLSEEAKHKFSAPAAQPSQQKPAHPTVAHKPSASKVSPGLVAATGVGVAAGTAIFTAVAIDRGMLGGEGGQISGAMADLSSIDMPDMPDPDIDLAPVGDALSGLGEMGGDAVNGAGEVVGDLGESLRSGFDGIDMGGISTGLGDALGGAGEWAGDAAGNASEWAGDAAGNASEWAGGAAGNASEWAGSAAGNASEWAGGAAGNASEWAGNAGEGVGDAVGGVGEMLGGMDADSMCSCLSSLMGGGDNED